MICIKKIISLALSFAAGVSLLFGGYDADAAEQKDMNNIVLLGDSITYGYGLSDEEHDYGYYLGEYFDAEVENYAQNGLTTDGLIEKLDDPEIQSSVKKADLICFSIGGNDLLHIFMSAFAENGIAFGNKSSSDSNGGIEDLGISSDLITKFMMEYSSQLAPAASKAGENIKKIEEDIEKLNPDAEIVIQTVYNPFETSNEKIAPIMKPFKSFASMYLGTINAAVKECAPYIADISLKFSEKPYLFTNIDKFDIHPNFMGHMLIAEEIIETLCMTGDLTAVTEAVNDIPYGTYSQFPEFIKMEIEEVSKGELRRGSLEQFVQRANANAGEDNVENTDAAADDEAVETSKTDQTDALESEKDNDDETSKKSKFKSILSKVFMVLGALLIFGASVLRFVRKRKNK